MKLPETESEKEARHEHTHGITGEDASMNEASIGDAGNGADPFGGDLTEGPPVGLEGEPGHPEDILPDRIERLIVAAKEVEEVTARSHEYPPIELEELP